MSEQIVFGDDATDELIEVIEGKLWYARLPDPAAAVAASGGPPGGGAAAAAAGGGGGGGGGWEEHFQFDPAVQYERFFADFGPLHLGHTAAFMDLIDLKLSIKNGKRLVLCSSDNPHIVANTVVMLGIYQMVKLGKSAEEAYVPFLGLRLPPFRDAVFAVCPYLLTPLDVLRGARRALRRGHWDPATFDREEYAHFSAIEHGDLNWVVPGKFAAFSGPLAQRRELEAGKATLTPEDYVPLFRRLGITAVVRFNKKCYDRRKFLEAGVRHHDLYYEDGGNPTDAILQRFLDLCERETGAIAVHCKAGLGRTGTNIGAYMMKHYGYTAAETIGWSRLCRPGMVNGPQQQYLEALESRIGGRQLPLTFQAAMAPFASLNLSGGGGGGGGDPHPGQFHYLGGGGGGSGGGGGGPTLRPATSGPFSGKGASNYHPPQQGGDALAPVSGSPGRRRPGTGGGGGPKRPSQQAGSRGGSPGRGGRHHNGGGGGAAAPQQQQQQQQQSAAAHHWEASAGGGGGRSRSSARGAGGGGGGGRALSNGAGSPQRRNGAGAQGTTKAKSSMRSRSQQHEGTYFQGFDR